jgi:hypothetical protein
MLRPKNRRALMGPPSPDGTIGIVASIGRSGKEQDLVVDAAAAPTRLRSAMDRSAVRTDVALLVSALFLQRFTLPFGNTFLHLDLVAIGFILICQFLCGKLVIQYSRILSFLGVGLMATCSLLVNFKSTMLTGYFLFTVFFFLFTFIRSSNHDQYKRTLQGFQFLVMLLSSLGVAQFAAQFVVDGRELINFYGIVPNFLFSDPASGIHDPRTFGNIIKATGLFLPEPSSLSQLTALGILIEILEFRRPRYLLVMTLGFLLSYSGTGLMLLLLFLPLVGLRHKEAALTALFIVIFMVGLVATGIIDVSVFTSRIGEFDATNANSSAFNRFVAPLWLAAERFDIGSLQALLIGSGPGTVKTVSDPWFGGSEANWFKLFYEYGIIGSFIFCCFLASCFRRSRCPGAVIAAIIFAYFFLQGGMTLAIALCTLSGSESQHHHFRGSSQ